MREVEVYIHSFIFWVLDGIKWSNLRQGNELASVLKRNLEKEFGGNKKTVFPAGNGTPDCPVHVLS
jgi:hypothetical protein